MDRADGHLNDLNLRVVAFQDADPYAVVVEEDEEPMRYRWVLESRPVLPTEWNLIVGDVVHNARSSLDHLAWQLVEAHGGTPDEHTAFPIWRKNANPSPTDHRALVRGKLKGAHPDVLAFVDRMELHDGGEGHHIWALDKLNQIDKHRLLLVVESVVAGFTLGMSNLVTRAVPDFIDTADAEHLAQLRAMESHVISTGRRRIGDDGIVLAASIPGPATTDDFDVVFGVALDDLPEMPGLDYLSDLVQAARGTVEAFFPYL